MDENDNCSLGFAFFSRPSPKAGRELQTELNTRDDGPLASRSRSPGREST